MADRRGDGVALLRRHIDAFNDGDVDGVLATLSSHVVWVTGHDRLEGIDRLAAFFDEAMTSLRPRLEIQRSVTGPGIVVVELVEHLVHEGSVRTFGLVGVYDVADGLITRAKIYREGSADL